MLPNKWRFNTSQDWKVLGDDFESVSKEIISNASLQALGFHHSLLGYLEKRVPRFVDITDNPALVIEPKDDNQSIMDSKDEKARKELEHVVKKKE